MKSATAWAGLTDTPAIGVAGLVKSKALNLRKTITKATHGGMKHAKISRLAGR